MAPKRKAAKGAEVDAETPTDAGLETQPETQTKKHKGTKSGDVKEPEGAGIETQPGTKAKKRKPTKGMDVEEPEGAGFETQPPESNAKKHKATSSEDATEKLQGAGLET